tara:strand:+ start:55 stop:231 length:177 start_codon:yes stop_codon:yes gene_type:complete
MKTVTNKSLQSFVLYFQYPNGAQSYWLKPGHTITVPGSAITGQVQTLQRRRLLEITGS